MKTWFIFEATVLFIAAIALTYEKDIATGSKKIFR